MFDWEPSSCKLTNWFSRFEQNYLPWLNFSPIREVHSPLLDLVYCTIASRHLDDRTRAEVAPRLQSLTAENVARMILQSRRSETLESIQCLLILSLWAPVCGVDEDSRDGRLLVASAVTMAHNMRLNEACQVAARLQSKREKGEDVHDQELFEAMNKTRLVSINLLLRFLALTVYLVDGSYECRILVSFVFFRLCCLL